MSAASRREATWQRHQTLPPPSARSPRPEDPSSPPGSAIGGALWSGVPRPSRHRPHPRRPPRRPPRRSSPHPRTAGARSSTMPISSGRRCRRPGTRARTSATAFWAPASTPSRAERRRALQRPALRSAGPPAGVRLALRSRPAAHRPLHPGAGGHDHRPRLAASAARRRADRHAHHHRGHPAPAGLRPHHDTGDGRRGHRRARARRTSAGSSTRPTRSARAPPSNRCPTGTGATRPPWSSTTAN